MKKYLLIILFLSVFAVGFVSVNATAEQPILKTETGYEASKLLWSDVENPQGEYLGRITDLVIDPQGRIEFAIIQAAFPEVGNDSTLVAVPFSALSGPEGDYYVLSTTRERLVSAPRFDAKRDLYNRAFAEGIYKYFGLEPSWTEGGHEKGFRSDQDPFDLVG